MCHRHPSFVDTVVIRFQMCYLIEQEEEQFLKLTLRGSHWVKVFVTLDFPGLGV